MTVLFLGGTGTISTACAALVADRSHDLTLVTRGHNDHRAPAGAEVLHADVLDLAALAAALSGRTFDVVVDWVAFTPDHVADDLRLFAGQTGKLVFISSASAYQTPPQSLPVTEGTPLDNPVWTYAQNKIACERRFGAARDKGVTVVRPSHTYAPWAPPLRGGYTVLDRLRRGAPVLVHGDGLSLWTLTHRRDFARRVAAAHAGWGDSLLGDKAHARVFDNSLIKALVPDFEATTPWAEGAREMVAWSEADPPRRVVDAEHDRLMDRLVAPFA